jgi:hypothetical protein
LGVFLLRVVLHSSLVVYYMFGSLVSLPNKLLNKDKIQLAVFVPQHFSQL